jgi:ribosomal protein S18 acetylase RimI-like enzyme
MIRALRETDLIAFRALRVRALKEHPQHFGASLADERKTSGKIYLLGFGIGAAGHFVLGAFVDGKLSGVVGFRRSTPGHLKHKGTIWGMYVAPGHRGKGIGKALISACLARARKRRGLETVQLAVGRRNAAAIRLYGKAGFRTFAEEKRGLKVGGKYYDELWMRADFPAS